MHFPAQALAFIVLLCHVFIAFVKAVGLFAYIITVYSHCMRFAWLSPIYLNMAAGHRFICWSVIAPCLSAPFFGGIFHTVSGGICNDGGGRPCVACVHTLIALCVVV